LQTTSRVKSTGQRDSQAALAKNPRTAAKKERRTGFEKAVQVLRTAKQPALVRRKRRGFGLVACAGTLPMRAKRVGSDRRGAGGGVGEWAGVEGKTRV